MEPVVLSNALTGLTMLPVFVAVFSKSPPWRHHRVDHRRVLEGILLAVALGVTCTLAFLSPIAQWSHALAFYAPLPALIWAALRFGPTRTSLALTAVAFAAIWGADRGTGPLLWSTPDENVLTLQIFILLTTLPLLCLAVVSSARQRAVQLYRALLGSLQYHVAILDARGLVLQVNESWHRFANAVDSYPSDRVLAGDDYLAVTSAAAAAGDVIATRALTGVTSVLNRVQPRFEMEYERDHAGRTEWYTMSVEALERPDGGAVLSRANVTQRRKAQAEIEEQRRELSHLARVAVLGELSGALAHELRQPLTSILSNAQAARRLVTRRTADPAELTTILEDIVTEDRRAGRVIERLRALLKRGETHLQAVETSELLREVLELAHGELVARRIATTAIVEPDLPPIHGDRVQLQQVLLNLILNACEAMSSTVEAERALYVTVRGEPKQQIHFTIRDHGIGIPEALLDRLFEPFVTTKPEGLGLGLSISRSIVAAHGGRLWAENNVDHGATVHCLLASAPVGTFQGGARQVPDLSVPLDGMMQH